jgi:hypothetical protein
MWRTNKRKPPSRGRVVWKDDADKPSDVKCTHPYFAEVPVPDCYGPKLVIGSLWMTTIDLMREDTEAYKPLPVPYVVQRYWTTAFIPAGSAALYLGTVAVTEQTQTKRLIVTKRHSFFIAGAQYITYDLNCFKPA